jgi:hypothetical protein
MGPGWSANVTLHNPGTVFVGAWKWSLLIVHRSIQPLRCLIHSAYQCSIRGIREYLLPLLGTIKILVVESTCMSTVAWSPETFLCTRAGWRQLLNLSTSIAPEPVITEQRRSLWLSHSSTIHTPHRNPSNIKGPNNVIVLFLWILLGWLLQKCTSLW